MHTLGVYYNTLKLTYLVPVPGFLQHKEGIPPVEGKMGPNED
jgi:hypothetical protein